MSVILLDKNKFKNLLKEDLTSGKYNPINPYSTLAGSSSDPTEVVKNLGGDDVGSAKARSEYLRDKIEKNFSELGIPSYNLMGYMKSQGIFTLELIQQYNEPFDFSFVKEDGQKFSGKAIYNKKLSEKFKTLVLDLNNGEVKLKFTPESLKRPFLAKKNIWGKYKDKLALMGLQTNAFFDVEISGDLTPKTKEEEDNKENLGEKGSYYNGEDLQEVNTKLNDIKENAKFFTVIKQYKDDPDFQRMFLDSIVNTTKSIKINQKSLLATLKDLKAYGLLEIKKKGKGRKLKKFKANFQNFMSDLFSLFAKVSKNGKQSETFKVIKNFYKELYIIALKGEGVTSQTEKNILLKKMILVFSIFLKKFTTLPEMTKGRYGKPENKEKEIKVKKTSKVNMNTVESIINSIADNIKLITEEEKNSLEKIKILKIGILQDLDPEEKESKEIKISDKKFIKCKADLRFESDEDDTIFNKATKKQIVEGLSKGTFFVRMTQKPKGLVLIFSKTNNESGSFFTLAGKNIKSPKDPSQWKGEVVVGDKAMGNKDFKGSKAFIKKLVLSK
jgi:hypothetical protein